MVARLTVKIGLAAILWLGWGGLLAAFGEVLIGPTTNNGSFESPLYGPGDTHVVPAGWSGVGGSGLIYLSQQCSWRPAAAEGVQFLLLKADSVSQPIGNAARAGYAYTLSADYGNGDSGSTYRFTLEAVNPANSSDAAVLIDSGQVPNTNTVGGIGDRWNEFSATSLPVASEKNGWNLRVTIVGGTAWGTVDNVRLTAAKPETLILNGTMETGSPPSYWLSNNAMGASSTDYHLGTKSLQVTPTTANGYVYQALTLVPNTPYRLEFWYKSMSGSLSANIQVDGVNVSTTACAATLDWPYWTHMIAEFSTPGQVSAVKIVFAGNPSPPFLIDDVCLREVPTRQTALQEWRAEFPGREYVCWQKDSCWDNIFPMVFPGAGVRECTAIDVKMGRNEYESKSFMITNLTDADLNLGIGVIDSPVPVILRQAAWVTSYDNHRISDALPRIKGTLTIPSGESREVWLTLNTIPGPASELVPSGNMETGDVLSAWSATDAVLSIESDGHSGTKSLKVAASAYIGNAHRSFSLKPDTRYRLDFWYKCLSGRLYTSLNINGASANIYGDIFGAASWTRVVREFDTPGPAANALVAFCGLQAGDQVLIDDVSLREVTDTAYECIANGRMEVGNPPADWLSSGAVLAADSGSHEGHQSLKITSNSGYTGAFQTLPVNPGMSYTLDFWYQGSAYVFLSVSGRTGIVFSESFNAAGWTHIVRSIALPADCSPTATLNFCGLAGGSLMVDEVSFKPSMCNSPVLPGTYPAHITLTPSSGSSATIALNTTVYPVTLPDRKPVYTCYWDLIVPDWTLNAGLFYHDLKAHSANVAVIHSAVAPLLRFDAFGNRLPSDYTALDRTLDGYLAMNPKFYLFSWGEHSLFGQDATAPSFMSDAWIAAFREWLADWVAHLQARGIGYENFAMYPYDEKIGPEVCQIAQLIKSADSNVKFYADSMNASIPDIDAIAPYIDVWCPLLPDYLNQPPYANGPEKDEARRVLMPEPRYFWTYSNPLRVEPSEASAYREFRLAVWRAWTLGMGGCGCWVYNYKSHWNSFQSPDGRNWAVVYPGRATDTNAPSWLDPNEYVIPGKRWEATREGVEDYTYLYLLRYAIANPRPGATPEAIAEAQTLLNSWPQTVLDPNSNPHLADQVKEEIINALLTIGPLEPEPQVEKTPGDANGDGKVDVSDLGILAANYGLTGGGAWGLGDFNGDGKVDVSDLGILAANYGTGTGATSDFAKDAGVLGLTVEAKEETPAASDPGCGSLGLGLIAGILLLMAFSVKQFHVLVVSS